MSSLTPPMTRTTKYEDIPPRFRKVWIKGNAESVQKKLDAPIQDFSFSMPLHQSNSDSNLLKPAENRVSGSHSICTSDASSPSSSSIPPLPKHQSDDGNPLSEATSRRSGGINLLQKENDGAQSSVSVAYSGPSSLKYIVNNVVDTNIARSTPPVSRSSSPLGNPILHNIHRASPQSRPDTRSNSPAAGTRSLTPAPSGWIPLMSRHSLRRFDIRPWGPRHLEYDYNEARKEFQAAAYYALGQYGYVPPKGVAKFKAPPPEELPSMNDLRKIPEFNKASKRLNAADRVLEEALARGESWENTPVPKEYIKFSLEKLDPDDFCTHRSGNAVAQDRSRSSVTLEEATGRIKPSLPPRSLAASTSGRTSASASDRGAESLAADDSRMNEGVSSVLSVCRPPSSDPPSHPCTRSVSPDSAMPQRVSASNLAKDASVCSRPNADALPSRLVRKRLIEEMESDKLGDRSENADSSNANTDRSSKVATRPNSPIPVPALPLSKTSGQENLVRTETGSTSGSGTTSSSGEASVKGSPPTSVSTSVSKRTRSAAPISRALGRGGRRRGRGRGARKS